MTKLQETFRSRLGFVLSASGAAVGLGNIWAFPTQVADNGGAVFILIYLLMIVAIGYPIMTLELALGKYGGSDPIASMKKAARHPWLKLLGGFLTVIGILVPTTIITFYNIVAGWIILSMIGNVVALFSVEHARWFFEFSLERNLLGSMIFFLLTIAIIRQGVQEGIEKWSSRMMPALIILFIGMLIFILTQPGASDGIKHFFIPNFEYTTKISVWMTALSQACFSLTIGACVYLAYGAYSKDNLNIPIAGAQIAFIDTFVALLAGIVIIPAMFVAVKNGVTIFNDQGSLISSSGLIFQVLPALFDTLGLQGRLLAIVFFALMTLAALTSSISMLEIPVSSVKNYLPATREQLTWSLGIFLFGVSVVICVFFNTLFDAVITFSTARLQPFFAIVVCFWGAWVLGRAELLKTIMDKEVQETFWVKALMTYVRYVCPFIAITIFYQAVFA